MLRVVRFRPGLTAFMLPAVLAISIGIAALNLGSPSLWLDEAYTWWFSTMSWPTLLQAARIDGVNPPFYYLAVKGLLLGHDRGEATLRLASVLAQGIAGLALWWAGNQVGSKVGGVAASLFWAFHPMSLWYARDARPYALAAAMSATALASFLALRQKDRAWMRGLAWVSISLALVTHYFAFTLFLALLLIAGSEIRIQSMFFRRWSFLSLLSLLPLASWLLWFFQMPEPSLGIGWIQMPRLVDLPMTAWNMLSGYGGAATLSTTLFGAGVAGMTAIALLRGEMRALMRRIALFGLLSPMAAVWTISLRRPVYLDRYFLILLPFMAVLVAAGAGSLYEALRTHANRSWIVASIVFLPLLIVSASAALEVHRQPKFAKEDWRGLAAVLQNRQATAESLRLSEPEAILPLAYYEVMSLRAEPRTIGSPCGVSCWWLLRQPYTAVHAFAQSIAEPGRDWPPSPPSDCRIQSEWSSSTGLIAWSLRCDGAGEE